MIGDRKETIRIQLKFPLCILHQNVVPKIHFISDVVTYLSGQDLNLNLVYNLTPQHKYIRIGGGYRHSLLFVRAMLEEIELRVGPLDIYPYKFCPIEFLSTGSLLNTF